VLDTMVDEPDEKIIPAGQSVSVGPRALVVLERTTG
jgi:hypothetical protein